MAEVERGCAAVEWDHHPGFHRILVDQRDHHRLVGRGNGSADVAPPDPAVEYRDSLLASIAQVDQRDLPALILIDSQPVVLGGVPEGGGEGPLSSSLFPER